MPIDPDLHAELLERFEQALPGQTALGESLIRRYAEPHRRYHDVTHLVAVLRRIEELADSQDLFLVRLAAWYHDAVYAIPPGQVTNEEASARLSIRELSRAGLEQEDLNQVARLVRMTADHLPGSRDPEGELLCDADLAVLAGTPEEYEAYRQAVRAEYERVPEADFVAGRLAILEPMLETEIFRTGKGRALNEAAQRNLAAECEELAARLAELRPETAVEGSNP